VFWSLICSLQNLLENKNVEMNITVKKVWRMVEELVAMINDLTLPQLIPH
jgi:hypothetical protein